MKELSIEQKAELCDDLIRRLKDLQSKYRFETIKEYFPELEESEDERIRKTICKLLWDNAPYEEAQKYITWLEKQKAIDILNEEEREFADDIDSFRKDMDEAYQKGYNEGVRITLEKQDDKPQKTSIWKHWKDGIAGNGNGEPIYLIKCGNTYSLSSGLGFECDYILLSDLDKCGT